MILLSQAVHLEYLGLVLHLDSDENQVAEVEDSVVIAGLVLADWADCDCVPSLTVFLVDCHFLCKLSFTPLAYGKLQYGSFPILLLCEFCPSGYLLAAGLVE